MKIFKIFIFIIFCVFAIFFGDVIKHFDNHSHEVEEEVHEDEEGDYSSIEISEAAIEKAEIQAKIFPADSIIILPRSAMVKSKDHSFVYIKDNLNFKEIEIEPIEINDDIVSFKHNDLNNQEYFVINGSNHLRMIFLNKNNPVTGHSH